MLPEYTDEELALERARLEKMVALCKRYGEADGETAVRAQLRAVTAEKVRRDAERD